MSGKRIVRWVLVGLIAVVFGWVAYSIITRYEGDGVYTVNRMPMPEGLLLKDHNLTFPEFRLDKTGQYTWHFKNYCSSNTRFMVSLNVSNPRELAWWTISTRVNVVIRDQGGKIVFEKNSPLNAHQAQQMSRDQSTRQPDFDWQAWYAVVGRFGEASSQVAINGIPKKEASYYGYTLEPIECLRSYEVQVSVSEISTDGEPLLGTLSIVSGWK